MKLKSIELENIRSYENGKLDFPEGSVLLSGDIGCGKSTLLLATEFALFGIRRGELSGTSLLRRGKKRGSVSLTFSIDNKEIMIERALKRTASSVSQDSGRMIVDGVEQLLTPTELKARILQYLGYPQELVDIQKSPLYRYTVYTPQEELKKIMRLKPEDRLESLRKVFGVDRYQLIVENLDQFLGSLRTKKRELRVRYQDLDEKQKEQSNLKGELEKIKKDIDKDTLEENSTKGELDKWKKEREGIESQIAQYNQLKVDLATEQGLLTSEETRLDGVRKQLIRYRESLDKIDSLQSPTEMSEEELRVQIDSLERRTSKCIEDPHGENETIDTLLEGISSAKEALQENTTKQTETKAAIKNLVKASKELKAARDICPICGKSLDKAHKDKKLAEYKAELDALQKEQDDLKTRFDDLTKEGKELGEKLKHEQKELVKTIREEKMQYEQLSDELRRYTESVETREKLISDIKTAESSEGPLIKKIEEFKKEIGVLEKQIAQLKGVEQTKAEIDGKVEEMQDKLSDVKSRLSAYRATGEQMNSRLKGLSQEIKQKKKARVFETNLKDIETWLEKHLTNLAGTIEKHYLVELKRKFDPMFSQWFNLLIDDEQLDVRIDDEFTPIIEQEGYEADYEDLSGGESASVALSYRLALNKVINTMVDDIKTKDIIILDEPTDGFSNDQMDKIRDVINELGAKQTIIVSHEPKIESYMDNIVRISKEDGVSRIAS